MQTLCRDCGRRPPPEARTCGSCGSARLLRHRELHDLAIAHLDCDAFYAAVEKRDRPELRDLPVIVGGRHRGVVAACCYIARTYGVRSAMPMSKALRLCSEATVIKPDMKKYATVGRQVRTMMLELTPLVEPLSIDEAFMDLTGTESLHRASGAEALAGLARRVESQLCITVSIGLSYNKFLAKIASDLDKPRGFAVIGRSEARSFLAGKPVGLLWGVGAAMEKRLARDGIRRIGELSRLGKPNSPPATARWAGGFICAYEARTSDMSIPFARPRASPRKSRSMRICPTRTSCARSCGDSPRPWRGE